MARKNNMLGEDKKNTMASDGSISLDDLMDIIDGEVTDLGDFEESFSTSKVALCR